MPDEREFGIQFSNLHSHLHCCRIPPCMCKVAFRSTLNRGGEGRGRSKGQNFLRLLSGDVAIRYAWLKMCSCHLSGNVLTRYTVNGCFYIGL